MQKKLEEERNHEEGSSAHEDSTKTINELEDRIRNLQKLVINNNSTQYSAPKVTRRQTVCLSSLRQNQFARPFPIQRQKTTTEEEDLFPEDDENALDRIDQDRELNLLQQIGKSKARYCYLAVIYQLIYSQHLQIRTNVLAIKEITIPQRVCLR